MVVSQFLLLTILLILTLGIVIIGCSQNIDNKNQNSVNEFDSLFTEILSDSLHVFTSGYKCDNNLEKWSGKIIPENLINSYNLNPEGTIALGKLYFDTKKEMIGYLIGNKEQNRVFLYIYSKEKKQNIINLTVASNTFLEGTYEEIANSWILDLDNNRSLDIAIWKRLTDFEFPNEYAGNISKDERFSYLNLGYHFEYNSWKTKIMETVKLEK